MEKINKKEAINVLEAWTALEVLSPQTFLKPEDLAGGEPLSVALFNNNRLPWENGGEKAKPNIRLFYQVIIGTIDFEQAINALIEKYGDKAPEKSAASGEAIIGIVVVDHLGYLIKDTVSVGISSFAWGVPQALKGDLKGLSDWPSVESNRIKDFDLFVRRKDQAGNNLPLTKIIIDEACNYLVNMLGIPKQMANYKKFAIRTYESLKKEEKPQPLLLNSFYLNDIDWAKSLIATNNAPENLLRYLSIKTPLKRCNILDNNEALKNIVAPQNIPPSRWPGAGRHPLVLLQQAAVNLSMSELKRDGILAINGPPGTGKTTLLRDIVANIVSMRAESLLKYHDPSEAFTYSGHKFKAGNGWLHLYKLNEDLKGFEILITSSNNKAVENISAELPSLKAIANDANGLRYFSTLSDELLGYKTWGLISAVLGNASNRNRFRQKFWWDNDFGFATYLARAAGMQPIIEIKDPKTGKIIESRIPKIIIENDPPRNHNEALKRWQQARKRFEQVLKRCKNKLTELEEIRQIINSVETLKNGLDTIDSLENIIIEQQKLKPNFIAAILNYASYRDWQKEYGRLSDCYELKKKVDTLSPKLGPHLIDDKFFSKTHEEINQTSPWCDSATQALRDEVFIEAIRLSKAFIDAAAKPLRNNLGILMQTFGKQNDTPNAKVLEFMPDLWSSFFLVVPSVSTTFASVGRMLAYLPQNSLGWLLIDEAGQALPQSAIGAIIRTKRAAVTGDPLQIEPVVVLPASLTENICRQFQIDPNRFNAPKASVQTLSDAVTSYFAEFHTKHGSRTVGFPLLVHRRCAEPMFSISNAIAYEHLMVQAKNHKASLIRECLGHSLWINIQGQAQDKWCIEEGDKVIELLNKLKNASILPDLYIITPFRVVAYNLRKLIKESGILHSWITTDTFQWLYERIGTLHTVQGREAEAVIIVLGAPSPDQTGSRSWAGSTPNLLNVAVTRAKEAVYVIGNKNLWKEAGVFKELHDRIDHI